MAELPAKEPLGDAALLRLRITVGCVGVLPPFGVFGVTFRLFDAPVAGVGVEVSSEEQLGLGVTLALEGVVVSIVTVLSVSSSSPIKYGSNYKCISNLNN